METTTNLNEDHLWHSFSDQLRLQTPSTAPSDSIWNDSFLSSRRNHDPARKNLNTAYFDQQNTKQGIVELNSSFGWKNMPKVTGTGVGHFNMDLPKSARGKNVNYNDDFGGKGAAFAGKKKQPSNGNNSNGSGEKGGGIDKRFKTLPAAEALPRNEAVGGYIFVCNNDTMPENLQRMLFGLPPRYRDSVRAITPGLPLFLYNYSTHQLHGIYQAASFGGTNIDPSAWEDKKGPGQSRFPAQVKATTRRTYEPLEEEDFRPILHHYDGPKFRLELNVPEALALLDKFEEKMSW